MVIIVGNMKTILFIVFIAIITNNTLVGETDKIVTPVKVFIYRTGITFFTKETDIFDSPGPFSTHTHHHSEGYLELFKNAFDIPPDKPWAMKEDPRFIFHAEKFLRRFLTCVLGNLNDAYFMEDCFYKIALRHTKFIHDPEIIDDVIQDLGYAVWYFVRLNCPDSSMILSYESFHFHLMSQALDRSQDTFHLCSFAWMKIRILMLRAFVFAFKKQNYRESCYGQRYAEGETVWELDMVDEMFRKMWEYDEYRICNSTKIGNLETDKTWTNSTGTHKPECITKYKFRRYVD